MSQEIFCTSAPRGLKPGSKGGFCTVAATEGMSSQLAEQLERLSGYRAFYPVGHPDSARNPVSFAHWRVNSSGRSVSVMSRVAFAIDYSQRTSRFAHHLVLDPSELPAAGPAWAMMQSGVMETDWAGEPRYLSTGRSIPRGEALPRVCEAWAAATGDAGWAGALAEAFVLDASRPAYILYSPGTELLPLLDEAIALLPREKRWQVTFNTYFTSLPSGLECAWRCCAVGSEAAKDAHRLATSGLVIDLSQRSAPPKESKYVNQARVGGQLNGPAASRSIESDAATRSIELLPLEESFLNADGPSQVGPFARRRAAVHSGEIKTYEVGDISDVGTGLAELELGSPTLQNDQRGSESRGRSGRKFGMLLTIAIGWPIAVAASLTPLILHKHEATAPDINGRIASLEKRLEEEQKRADDAESLSKGLKGRADRLQADLQIASTQSSQPSSPTFDRSEFVPKKDAAAKEQAFKDEIKSKDETIKSLNAKLQTLAGTQTAPSQPLIPVTPQVDSLPFPSPKIFSSDPIPLVKGTSFSKVGLTFPNGDASFRISSKPLEELSLSVRDSGVLVLRKHDDLYDQKSSPLEDPLAILSVKNGSVNWLWTQQYFQLSDAKKIAFSSVIRCSRITFADTSNQSTNSQFIQVAEKGVWHMQDDLKAWDITGWDPTVMNQIVMGISGTVSGWQATSSLGMRYDNGGVSFDISMKPSNGMVSSSFGAARRDLIRARTSAREDEKRSGDDFSNLENQIKELQDRASKPKVSEDQKKELQTRTDRLRTQSNTAAAAKSKASAELSAVNQKIKNLQAPKLAVQVKLKNGVVVSSFVAEPNAVED